jgi:hypothetical protein
LDIGPFSDVFRFKLLLEQGGWWVDTDVICNSDQFPECQYAWANEFHQTAAGRVAIGTSQIKFPKNEPVVQQLYYESSRLASIMTNREEIGPQLISRVVQKHGTPNTHFGSTEQFYPIEWIEAFKLWLPQCREEVIAKTDRAFFIACWASLATYMGIDLNREPPSGSYLADIFSRFAPSRSRGDHAFASSEIVALAGKWFCTKRELVPELRAVTSPSVMALLGISSE